MVNNRHSIMRKQLSLLILAALFSMPLLAQMEVDPLSLPAKNPNPGIQQAPKSVITSGDTISYCGNSGYVTSVGYSSSAIAYWGIMLPSSYLSGRNYLKSVMLYVYYPGTYTLNVYSGGTSEPTSLYYSQTVVFNANQTGWQEILLDSVCTINTSDNLWITFYNAGISYPASACNYTGDINSDWITNYPTPGNSWYHAISGESYSWLIKAVTSATNPLQAAPSFIISGPTALTTGDTATFTFFSPNTTSMNWNVAANYIYNGGNFVRAVWNTPGIKHVIATATNSYGTTTDTFDVNVVNCTVSNFPKLWDFENDDEMLCWTFVDQDSVSNGWYYYYSNTNIYSSDGSSGLVYSASYNSSPDNWIITPAIQLPAGMSASLSWDAGPYSDDYYAENYGVYISTTGTAISDFIPLEQHAFSYYFWEHPSINLTSFAGQTVHVAFRHYNCNSGDLFLDNVKIEVGDPVNINCSGNGSGMVYRTGSYSTEYCGVTERIPAGSMVSFDFVPTNGNLTHLYVNNVDCISNAVLHTTTTGTPYSVPYYSFSFTVAGTTNIEAVFEYTCDTITSFPYVQDFESAYASNCLTIIDADNDGFAWIIGNDNNGHNGSAGFAASASYINDVLYPDNWMILPAMSLPAGSGIVLKWFVTAIDANYQYEHYGVYVSTTGNSVSDFTTELFNETTTFGWVERTVDLSAYAGQTVYIAFRHHNCSDMYWLLIDDITVEVGNVVSVNCTGNGSGVVYNTANYTNDLCGSSEMIPVGFVASYDFIPTDGSLTHLYVNSVDHINDVVTHSSGTAVTYYTYSFTVTGNTTLNPVFEYPTYPVIISCSGDGTGEVYNINNYYNNLCGAIDSVRQGFIASYEFIPSAGNDLTHLYVNSIDRISDAYHYTYGTYSSTYTYSFLVDTPTVVTPVFTRIPYTITATSADPTMGMVSGGGVYFYDSVAIITATPMPHYQFLYWMVTVDGTTTMITANMLPDGMSFNPLQFEVYSDMQIVAYFGPESYTINVSANNVLYGSAVGGGTFEYLTPVTVSATAFSGYHFSMWSNGSTYNPYTFPASEDLDLVAIFVADGDTSAYYVVTVEANDPEMGGVTGGGVFTMGASTTIAAIPNNGYHFVQWQDGNTQNPRTVTVTGNITYTAYFASNQGVTYTITVLSSDETKGNVSGGGIYGENETAVLTARAYDGFRFMHWQDGDTVNPRTITVTADATFIATFGDAVGIDDVVYDCARVYSYADRIYVSGTMGRSVKVFDITGRLMTRVDNAPDALVFGMQHVGVYIVTVGDKAYRVVVR